MFERVASGDVPLPDHDIDMDPGFVPNIGDKIYSERLLEPDLFLVVDRFFYLGETGQRIYGASLIVERIDEEPPS